MFKIKILAQDIDVLHTSITVIYSDHLRLFESAETKRIGCCTFLNVPPILIRNDVFSDEYVIVDGHHRTYDAKRRNVGIDAILIEKKEDCCNLPEKTYRSVSRHTDGDGMAFIAYAFEEAIRARKEIYPEYDSISSIRIVDKEQDDDKLFNEELIPSNSRLCR